MRLIRSLVLCVMTMSAVGCIAEPLTEECSALKQVAESEESRRQLRAWIDSIIEEPQALAGAGKTEGALFSHQLPSQPDWESWGIPSERVIVEFYGKGVDYRDIDREAIEAVVVSYGLAHMLIFKLQAGSKAEEEIVAGSAGTAPLRTETLSKDLILACAKPRR